MKVWVQLVLVLAISSIGGIISAMIHEQCMSKAKKKNAEKKQS